MSLFAYRCPLTADRDPLILIRCSLESRARERRTADRGRRITDGGRRTAAGVSLVELMLVTAVALFLSTFSSPFLSAALTFGLWVIGHFNTDLRNFEAVVESKSAAYVARGLYYVLPNFAAFDIKTQVVHALPVEASYVATTALYGAVYIGFLLTGAVAVFSRRDFK